jgi:hypothetical protein
MFGNFLKGLMVFAMTLEFCSGCVMVQPKQKIDNASQNFNTNMIVGDWVWKGTFDENGAEVDPIVLYGSMILQIIPRMSFSVDRKFERIMGVDNPDWCPDSYEINDQTLELWYTSSDDSERCSKVCNIETLNSYKLELSYRDEHQGLVRECFARETEKPHAPIS